MKILFKNTTKYTKEKCNDFLKFHDEKYGRRDLIKFILFSIGILYILVFNIINKNWLLVVIAILLGILLYLYKKSKLEQDKGKRKKIKEYTFFFYQKYIKIKYKRQFERLRYFEFHKIFETENYFFLYLDDKKSLILEKDGFSIGTAEEFSKFIKNKCPLKYSKEIK